MAIFSISKVKISGIVASIPKNEVSNFDIAGMSEEEIELLVKTVGINKRRVADSNMNASDLCFASAKKLLSELNWKKEEIDVLIFVTQTPDQTIPGTSMLLQQRLGLSASCMTLDINQGCAGYVYGLANMASILSASGLKNGLLLVGDTITKLLEEGDNSTVPIFSDAGSATALVFDSEAPEMHFNLMTDGSKYHAIFAEKGGRLKMKGHEIFTFGLKEVIPNIEELLLHCKYTKEEIDYFVFHQANLLLNESIRKKLKLPTEKVPMTLDKYGNTSCATIPLTIVSELVNTLTKKNMNVVLSGFGVGLSWGSAFVNISDIQCLELIEL
ncbi:MAG: 3-oxoacyl-[acyl-carrier-protein] synthase-3 [Flavobacteriaceae bacterium]